MTFREYKEKGGDYDRLVWANDAGSFGHKGGSVYGYCPGMEEWEIACQEITTNGRIVLHILYPHREEA